MRKTLYIVCFCFLVAVLPFQASAQEKSRFDRGINSNRSIFIPKGEMGLGLSLSYNNLNMGSAAEDAGYRLLFGMLDGIKGSLQSFGISPQISYFVADNISIGLRFDYSKTAFNVGKLNMELGDMLSLNISDKNFRKQGYTGLFTMRNYMPIAGSKRFAIFAEGNIAGSYAQSEAYSHNEEGGKVGTYQDIYRLSLGVVPGIICFITNNAAFELSVGVFGFDIQKTKQITNQVEISEMVTSNANFKINPLSITLGMTYYFSTR